MGGACGCCTAAWFLCINMDIMMDYQRSPCALEVAMTISILVEPGQVGFGVMTGLLLDLSAEAASAAEAVNALQEKIANTSAYFASSGVCGGSRPKSSPSPWNPAALSPAWMGASGGSSVAEKGQIQRCGMRLAPV